MKKYGLDAELIYENRLSCERDIGGFVLEGSAGISFPDGKMRLENAMPQSEGQRANYVLWCPETFPSDVVIEWNFRPLREPGLAMMFFAVSGRGGEDLFSPALSPRTGEYPQYHHGDINAFHISYFRRKEPDERAFHTCNLRKSYGFYLTAQGGDPIPNADEAKEPYKIGVVKHGARVEFYVNELLIFTFDDDGKTYGDLLGGGKIGFRQLAPMIGEYSELSVYSVK
ncbi:MAG: YesU family protein [Firmicutes bacterium]|nr:YesU family protein [Bacillota bacterium]